MEISFDEDTPLSLVESEKERETAAAISEMLDGLTIEETERILFKIRGNYRNAIYRKAFRD